MVKDGACADHQRARAIVMEGGSPRCPHGTPIEQDCIGCSLADRARKVLATVGDAKARAFDAALRSLQAELAFRDIQAVAGPGEIATHLSVTLHGRVYVVVGDADEKNVRLDVRWGGAPQVDAAGVPEEVIGAVVLFLVGVRERGR